MFDKGIGVIPPKNSPRFSLVVGDQFLFLRGDRLEIYSDNNFEAIEVFGEQEIPDVISRYFGYALPSLSAFSKIILKSGSLRHVAKTRTSEL